MVIWLTRLGQARANVPNPPHVREQGLGRGRFWVSYPPSPPPHPPPPPASRPALALPFVPFALGGELLPPAFMWPSRCGARRRLGRSRALIGPSCPRPLDCALTALALSGATANCPKGTIIFNHPLIRRALEKQPRISSAITEPLQVACFPLVFIHMSFHFDSATPGILQRKFEQEKNT